PSPTWPVAKPLAPNMWPRRLVIGSLIGAPDPLLNCAVCCPSVHTDPSVAARRRDPKAEERKMNNGTIHTVARAMAASLVAVVLALGVWAGPAAAADAADAPVTFGYQAWPGVTVKSQVAIQLLQAMGY